jgi:hypothetical protein
MRSSTFLLSLIPLTSALSPRQSDDTGYDRIEKLCFPTNSSGSYDLNAPCNKVFDMEAKCIYGQNYNQVSNENVSGDIPQVTPAKQKSCICNSAFFDYVDGYVFLFTGPTLHSTYMEYGIMLRVKLMRLDGRCSNCEKLHGAQEGVDWYPPSYIKSMSSAYCAETQTLGIDEFLGNYTESTSLPASLQTSMSDVLGNKTDVSLYWTASATDTKATGASETGTSASGTGATGSATGSAPKASSTGGAGAVGVEGVLTGLCVGVVMGFACLS